jgi:hypothetical protein
LQGIRLAGPPMLKAPFPSVLLRYASRGNATTIVRAGSARPTRRAAETGLATPAPGGVLCHQATPRSGTAGSRGGVVRTDPNTPKSCCSEPECLTANDATPTSAVGLLPASGTGINPWWRYEEQDVPGGGHIMVNVGTGNFVLQTDDMNVPHKGIALAFRRTYNSQSGHDVLGTDGGAPGMYGNGWTNTFDAHIVKPATGVISVYDIDGARYDYTAGASGYVPPAGQHAALAFDGQCGFLWTKKNGTVYHFYRTTMTAAGCNSSQTAYAGLLYQIVGRNQNTSITLAYSWDNGNAGPGGKISQIVATTESGLTATLAFADFSGHRMLQGLTRPDGTTVSYVYGGYGGLRTVTLPSNNAAGTPSVQGYGSALLSSTGTTIINYLASPRYNASGGTDGSRMQIAFNTPGSDNAHATLSEIDHYGFIDPSPADGSNAPVQPVPPNGSANGSVPFKGEYFALGSPGAAATPTYRDSDGHATNWVTDASGRPTQTQECTATQSQQCTGTLLLSGEQWDTDNNLVAEIEPRGFAPGVDPTSYETDYAYDTNGNTIVIAQPAPAPGAFRPNIPILVRFIRQRNGVLRSERRPRRRTGLDQRTGREPNALPGERAGEPPDLVQSIVRAGRQPVPRVRTVR